MNTEIVLSTKAAKAIVPKPTKLEIIKALALRKYNKLIDANAKAKAEYVAAVAELERLAAAMGTAFVPKPSISSDFRSYRAAGSSKWTSRRTVVTHVTIYAESITIKRDAFTAEMNKQAKILDRINTSGLLHLPELKEIERDIRDSMNNTVSGVDKRVQALLEDAATVKALDKTLEALEPQKAIAA